MKFHIPNWLKVREEVLVVKTMTDMSKIPDKDIWDSVSKLVETGHWKYFEELLRRERERLLKDLVLADNQKEADRVKGRIKTIDWLLQFNGFVITV